MGVKDLWTILAPAMTPVALPDLRGQTLAVDLSIWIVENQGVRQMQGVVTKPYLRNLFFRVNHLLQLGVNLIFVIEGEAPKLKWETMAQRNQARHGGRGRGRGQPPASRQGKRSHFNAIINECCQLLDSIGVPYVKSAGEAEAKCAFLNYKGIVDGCVTDDGDVFLYGARRVYRNFNMKDSHIESYDMADIESKLNLDRSRMVALGLLLGCDYVPQGVPGVGQGTAIKFFKHLGDSDILKRFDVWIKDKEHFAELERVASTKKPSHCNQCGHPGSAREHGKQGCAMCGSWQHCEPKPNDYVCTCTWHQKQQELSASTVELNIQKRAVQAKGFPWPKVVEEFLVSKDKLPYCQLIWECPKLMSFVKLCELKLEWVEDYSREKLLPLWTLWGMRAVCGIYTYKKGQNLDPQGIVKTRVRQGVPCYEVQWYKHADDSKFTGEYYTTIEESDLFDHCYGDIVELFVSSKPEKKIRKPAKAKEKVQDKENTDVQALTKSMGDIDLSSQYPAVKEAALVRREKSTEVGVLKSRENAGTSGGSAVPVYQESVGKRTTSVSDYTRETAERKNNPPGNAQLSAPLSGEHGWCQEQFSTSITEKSSDSSSEDEQYLPLSKRLAMLPKVNKKLNKNLSQDTSKYRVNHNSKGPTLNSKPGVEVYKVIDDFAEMSIKEENKLFSISEACATSQDGHKMQNKNSTEDLCDDSTSVRLSQEGCTSNTVPDKSYVQFDKEPSKYSQAIDGNFAVEEDTERSFSDYISEEHSEMVSRKTEATTAVDESKMPLPKVEDGIIVIAPIDQPNSNNLPFETVDTHFDIMSGDVPKCFQTFYDTGTSSEAVLYIKQEPVKKREPSPLQTSNVDKNHTQPEEYHPWQDTCAVHSKYVKQSEGSSETEEGNSVTESKNIEKPLTYEGGKKTRPVSKGKKTAKGKPKKSNKPWYSDSVFNFSADDDLMFDHKKDSVNIVDIICNQQIARKKGHSIIHVPIEDDKEALPVELEYPLLDQVFPHGNIEQNAEVISSLSLTTASYLEGSSHALNQAYGSTVLNNLEQTYDKTCSMTEGGFIREDSLPYASDVKNTSLQGGFVTDQSSVRTHHFLGNSLHQTPINRNRTYDSMHEVYTPGSVDMFDDSTRPSDESEVHSVAECTHNEDEFAKSEILVPKHEISILTIDAMTMKMSETHTHSFIDSNRSERGIDEMPVSYTPKSCLVSEGAHTYTGNSTGDYIDIGNTVLDIRKSPTAEFKDSSLSSPSGVTNLKSPKMPAHFNHLKGSTPIGKLPINVTWNKSQFGNFSIGSSLLNITCESDSTASIHCDAPILFAKSPMPKRLCDLAPHFPVGIDPMSTPPTALSTNHSPSPSITSHLLSRSQFCDVVTSSPMDNSVFAPASPIPLAERLLRRVDSQLITQMSQPSRNFRIMSQPCHGSTMYYETSLSQRSKSGCEGSSMKSKIPNFDDSEISLLSED